MPRRNVQVFNSCSFSQFESNWLKSQIEINFDMHVLNNLLFDFILLHFISHSVRSLQQETISSNHFFFKLFHRFRKLHREYSNSWNSRMRRKSTSNYFYYELRLECQTSAPSKISKFKVSNWNVMDFYRQNTETPTSSIDKQRKKHKCALFQIIAFSDDRIRRTACLTMY